MTFLNRILEFFTNLFLKLKALFFKDNITTDNTTADNTTADNTTTDNDENYVDDPNLMLFNFYIQENGLLQGKTKELGQVLSGYIKDPAEISNIIKLAEMGKKVKVLSKVLIEICWELDEKLRGNITKYKLNEWGSVIENGTEIESIINS